MGVPDIDNKEKSNLSISNTITTEKTKTTNKPKKTKNIEDYLNQLNNSEDFDLTKKFKKETSQSNSKINIGMKRKIRMKFANKENIEGCFSDEELDQEDVNDLENDEFKKPSMDNVNRVKELKKYQNALL